MQHIAEGVVAVMPESLLTKQINLLSQADTSRKIANGKLRRETKGAFGQYMTPAPIASFMAALLPVSGKQEIRLLDPGAGVGSLSSAFVEALCKKRISNHIDINAYEIDPVLWPYLEETLDLCAKTGTSVGCNVTWDIIKEDFIEQASRKLSSVCSFWPEKVSTFTHCIMNPPYRKLASTSHYQTLLHSLGIKTVNLYSAFVMLSISLLEDGGHLVAIIPRSFCNGAYYLPFREFLLKHTSIRRIHLFGSRRSAFKEDNVLQENIILLLQKNGKQENVTVSFSNDGDFSNMSIADYSFSQIVQDGSKELFIHIPIPSEANGSDHIDVFKYSLDEIGLQVSTGPVVDFRVKEFLREMPEAETVPLLYSCHLKGDHIEWPIKGCKKPNAILIDDRTRKWLYPNGFYTVVRRFSSKEEKKRIVATVIDPASFKDMDMLGIENHLNVFHYSKGPISQELATGLMVYLNSTIFDDGFRRFSGHTQVNATDLRAMRYPSRETLIELGTWAILNHNINQTTIDQKVESLAK